MRIRKTNYQSKIRITFRMKSRKIRKLWIEVFGEVAFDANVVIPVGALFRAYTLLCFGI